MLTSPPRAVRKNLMMVRRWLLLEDSAGYGSSPNAALSVHLKSTLKHISPVACFSNLQPVHLRMLCGAWCNHQHAQSANGCDKRQDMCDQLTFKLCTARQHQHEDVTHGSVFGVPGAGAPKQPSAPVKLRKMSRSAHDVCRCHHSAHLCPHVHCCLALASHLATTEYDGQSHESAASAA